MVIKPPKIFIILDPKMPDIAIIIQFYFKGHIPEPDGKSIFATLIHR